MTPHEFVQRWRGHNQTERQSYQQFFLDLCRLVEHKTPNEYDPEGKTFCFEAGVTKNTGGHGFADVWFKGRFAIEFKGPDGNLDKAYRQLLEYREALENPPLLIVSDTQVLRIHANFTNMPKREVVLRLEEIETAAGLQLVRNIFYNPEAFRPEKTAAQVTEEAATEFAKLAEHLRRWGYGAQEVAHYLIRLLFILFAEDIDLLPRDLFTRLVETGQRDGATFNKQMRQLFHAMQEGDVFGESPIRWFNGGLFDSDRVLELDGDGLKILQHVTQLDWAGIEPSILGTLFTRSLDPSKRAQLGAHYTSRDDILLIVEPVLMAPLRREWAAIQEQARALVAQRDKAPTRAATARLDKEATTLVMEFVYRLRTLRVLDPACGSGNFLYVSLRLLMDLEQEVSFFCGQVGLQPFFPLVGPRQLYGIEKDPYAHELAQATVWIGYLQWHHDFAGGSPGEPVLQAMDNIKEMDAILAYDAEGKPCEPEWPEADVIVGNPPFLGDKKMWGELGSRYVEDLRHLYAGQLPGGSDLVCYWFELAMRMIQSGRGGRAGLLATQGIRGGANRTVLDKISQMGRIFWAQSDRNWIQGDATVHVSMVGFERGIEGPIELDGVIVAAINPDLTEGIDVTAAKVLKENQNLAFIGSQKGGPFDITPDTAKALLESIENTDYRLNSDVIRPWFNGQDITQRPRGMYVIDFGVDMDLQTASLYVAPLEYARRHVKPAKEATNSEPGATARWWLHQRSRPEMRDALNGLARYIATPRVAKHRVFVWKAVDALADSAVVVVARSDEYAFGVLQSQIHELWARRTGTQLREAESGFRYSQTMTFETFPFPWPPGKEPVDDARVVAIGAAAADLVAQRDAWLNPPGLDEAALKKRTLTNLYNARPAWLAAAHERLDHAVLDAYGWPHDLGDEAILERLLALNLERAGG